MSQKKTALAYFIATATLSFPDFTSVLVVMNNPLLTLITTFSTNRNLPPFQLAKPAPHRQTTAPDSAQTAVN